MDAQDGNQENEDNQKQKTDLDDEDIDSEVNLEEKILSALEEIYKIKGKVKKIEGTIVKI